jgi:hypothetical protein
MGIELKGKVLYFETGKMNHIVNSLKSDQQVLPVPELFKVVFEISEGPMRGSIVTIAFDKKHSQSVAQLFNMVAHRIKGPGAGDVTQYHMILGKDENADLVRLDHKNHIFGETTANPESDYRVYVDMVFHK